MTNYRLILSYDGTKYMGWQRQSTDPQKTIQGKIEHVLSLLFEAPIQIIGSGRTDAGVHALMQVANFHAPTEKDPIDILNYLKQYLPKDIAILKLQKASPRFHARYNCTGKTYSYTIDMGDFANPFALRFAYHVGEPLAIDAMQAASTYLLGTHDFQSFTSMKSKKKSTIKTITSIQFDVVDTMCTITYSGNGFLQHMIRILSGTLIEVGLGHLQPEAVCTILEAKARAASGPTAPSHGLCLKEVTYD